MQRRHRNRNRSKRRAIHCLEHGCLIDSVSQKHALYAESAEQLQQRGMGRKVALMLTANSSAVPLLGEWLEAFWCPECQETRWYHVHKQDHNRYSLSVPPPHLWQQATGVTHPDGNPTASEFSRREARMSSIKRIRNLQSR